MGFQKLIFDNWWKKLKLTLDYVVVYYKYIETLQAESQNFLDPVLA